MSHEVETMFYAGQIPWHGLGEKLQDGEKTNIKEAAKRGSLNWQVLLDDIVPMRPLLEKFKDRDVISMEVLEYYMDKMKLSEKAVTRDKDNRVLGVVGPRWTPLQNMDAFDWFQPFIDAGEAILHTAGSLKGGRRVWVLAEIQRGQPLEIRKDDKVSKFILLSNSHDGKTSVRVGYTPVRVVCANTLWMATANKASQLIRLRHSKQLDKNLEAIQDIMQVADAEFNATADQYRWLAGRQINQADLKKYIKVILDVKTDVPETDLPTRTLNTIDKIVERFEKDKLASSNWWGAYNAVNGYLNHEKGRNADNRMESLWFGQNQLVNSKALKTAMQMAG